MDAFPNIPPHQGTSRAIESRILRAEFGDGYSQRTAGGLNNVVDEWQVSWANLPVTKADQIDSFLHAKKGIEAFLWTPPREAAGSIAGLAYVPAYAKLTRASVGWSFDAASKLQASAADLPRFDHDVGTAAPLGLLVESARTQAITNSEADNADSRPGTWAIDLDTNVTLTAETYTISADWDGAHIVRLGVSNSDSVTRAAKVRFEASQIIAGTNADTFAVSVYAALVSGTLAQLVPAIVAENSSGNSLGDITGSGAAPTAGFARHAADLAPTDPATAFVRPYVSLELAASQSATVELAIPQLELGSGATSPIPSTSAAVTRQADIVTFPAKLFTCAKWSREPSLPGADTISATFRQEFDLTV